MATLTPYQRDILIRTVAGEAMSESPAGQAAVVHTILNRAADGRWPTDPAKVALQPKQFSAWNKGAGGNALPYTIKPGSAAYEAIGQLVDGAASGAIADPTGGAVFYYAPKGMAGGKKPSWYGSANREGPARRLGNHIFLGRVGAPKTGAAATGGVLKRGSRGPAVAALQQTLADAGLYKGRIDGDYGPRTMDAVRAYQQRYGLSADGIAGQETQRSLAATAPRGPSATPGAITEPPPTWPDTFNPPAGLNVGSGFPAETSPFPGLPPVPGRSPGPGGPLGVDLATFPNPQERPFRGAPLAPVERGPDLANIGPVPSPRLRPDMPGTSLPMAGDERMPPLPAGPAASIADMLLRPTGEDIRLPGTDITPSGLPSLFAARPETPGALPGAGARATALPPTAALPPSFAATMGDYRPMMPDELTRSIAAFDRRKADFNRMLEENRGKSVPNFDFATAPTPLPNATTRPPPFSDRALMMGPRREDITTANSPFAAGIPELPAPPKPRVPDFDFVAGSGGDPSLAQWLERNGPNATKATAQGGGPLDFLSGVLPEQNLFRDLGLMGPGSVPAAAVTPPPSMALPPPPPPPAAPSASPVWDPFGTLNPNKDQSRHPAMTGATSSLAPPMGQVSIPGVKMADASGAWPALTADAFSERFGAPIQPLPPPPASYGTIPGGTPLSGYEPKPAALPGVVTVPSGGLPPPMPLTPPAAPAPMPVQTPPPVRLASPAAERRPEERRGPFNGPFARALVGFATGGPLGAALGLLGGRGIFGGGAPGTNLFSSSGTSVSPSGYSFGYGTWGNTGQRAVQGSNGQTYVQQSDGTWAQAL